MKISDINDPAWFKRLTLAINHLVLRLDAWMHQHYHKLIPFSSLVFLFMYICFFDFLNKWVIQKVRSLWRERGVLKTQTKTNNGRGEGQSYLYVYSVKKICLIF